MLFAELVNVSEQVRSTRSRKAKTEALAGYLRSVGPEQAPIAVSFLSGRPRQDRLGVGYATVYSVDVPPAETPALHLVDVDRYLEEIADASGPGSQAHMTKLLEELLTSATEDEQDFLRGLILRELRQGALQGVMADAVALALGVEADKVRRAAMVSGDLVAVAAAALSQGPDALDDFALRVLNPVLPMLAKTAPSVTAALDAVGTASVEWKLDGARIQAHKRGDEVAVFTRNLRDVTARVPEVVAAVRRLPVSAVILDGEALIVDDAGRPIAFQDSMSRFGTEDDQTDRALSPFFFDCLHLDGADLIDAPTRERLAALEQAVPAELRVARIVTADPEEAERFYEAAVTAGYEGVMVKDIDAPYEAGRRGGAWIKVKPAHTLDLVVLAAEWGSGRRQGWLSNLHLGARDPESGGFVMLGKTFKGLTDEMLAWQTERFLEIEDHRRGRVVYLKPEVVVEIAFDGVQRSTRYPGGMALRFARVKRFRDDKSAAEADTIETVRAFHEGRI